MPKPINEGNIKGNIKPDAGKNPSPPPPPPKPMKPQPKKD